jgi:hypothetical protein
MLKILYAAGNWENSKYQLLRFMEAIKDKPYNIKIAAYKKSSFSSLNIDFTLDCILHYKYPHVLDKLNNNFSIYLDQIRSFNPDLIISDLEYFSSRVAYILNIQLWQCSSLFTTFALKNRKRDNSTYSYHLYNDKNVFFYRNIIDNSDKIFYYSNLCDISKSESNFEWIRPYYKVGKKSPTCEHNIVAVSPTNNKKILSILKKYDDCVLFTDSHKELYKNIEVKSLNNEEEYYCNIRNCKLFICEGQENFLADGFYNNKYSLVVYDQSNYECVCNSMISQKYNLSKNIFNSDIGKYFSRDVEYSLNKDVRFLHERIDEIYS